MRHPFSRLWPLLLAAGLSAGLAACDLPETETQVGPASVQAPAPRPTRGPAAPTREERDPQSGLRWIGASDLPREGRRTLALIRAGGPFPYRKDGSSFGNRERLLPPRPGGGYREYTVPTPGEDDRGARRIVCAALTPPDAECYYTADHYASFRRIAP
nr:ribonuclease domain-containing protein [Deinococcus budaensis]